MLTSAVTFATDPLATDATEVDVEQARAAAAGDTRAFEQLYRRHVGKVHGVIVRLVGGHGARAEDLTQETFVRVWRALPEFRFESALSTWLHRMAVNTALMELRSRRAGPRWEEEVDGDDVAMLDPREQGPALRMDLERAIGTLPPRARAVLVLHDVEGWKHEEISASLGMAVGSSKAQLHRARQLLRVRLEAHQ
ncbi:MULTISPECIES: RNA polymerase sigma factor [Pseudoxanthomonas]|uniref:RNA polymerase sigma factor n=1 Tax=Pseudoxanthomonas winnipegensis TaxID=2480810 RepID=A0A4Q9TBB1_9GAMM|nr:MULTISPECIES: RNA polymerase sigma factor [Pseudoxanthomonas]MDQ1118295.1 RNA polymerase sigma factor (sigma-70 family) [Pseudoxanthomonas winnipegensis]MDQ1131476.1 RNA polymerase sigma factor (sigma-70 family) [Pseudoxanthomonas winnipegensis]MDR6138506.1 RNA polymerase sigma factor (sigma-70 family) [Pseudoxanthomonas sp. SORGH_AS_0997]RZZ83521.1 RNA polymerase sigma factor [Pseudoxanthomonas winnipegensis]TAA31773.1 RNA polymerase sigma factor [Pseudoxanthomonas winnipegensis]